jgi:hypothetical protein
MAPSGDGARMTIHHHRALGHATVPLALGLAGLIRLGHLHWGVIATVAITAVLSYRFTYVRSRNAEKYGVPPSTSILLRGVNRRDLYSSSSTLLVGAARLRGRGVRIDPRYDVL